MADLTTREGGCHCGAVRFAVDVPDEVLVQLCNCSMCSMCGYQHLIVPADRFRLLQGEDQLSRYSFNSGIARHLFCASCGIKSFYVPRSNPDGYSVNLRCLDEPPPSIQFEQFDGRNWEQNVETLRHLSRHDDAR